MQNKYLNYPTESILRFLTSVKDVKLFEVRLYSGNEMRVQQIPEHSIHHDHYDFKWYFGTCLDEYEETPFNEGNTYTLKDEDYEKFIKVTVTDTYGLTASRSFFVSRYPVIYINTENHDPIISKDKVNTDIVI